MLYYKLYKTIEQMFLRAESNIDGLKLLMFYQTQLRLKRLADVALDIVLSTLLLA